MTSSIENIVSVIEEHLNPQQFLVGGAVVVVKDGHLIYERGFGNAELGTPNKAFTPDTMVCVMSIAKSFTAASLLTLVEDGLLDLDAPLVNYMPYFQTTDRKESDFITVRQLLSHTAGFGGDLGIGDLVAENAADFTFYDEWVQQAGIPDSLISQVQSREDITRLIREIALADSPGDSWNYCTDAFIVAADLFEKVSGQSWDDYMISMFNRLNLNRTTINAEDVQLDENHAKYYSSMPNETAILLSPFPTNRIAAPMGFLYSTAKDLGQYLNHYMSNRPFISPVLIEKMFEPVWEFDPYEGYALGWGTSIEMGYNVIEHGGGAQGVSAYLCMVPSEKLGVIVLSNHDRTPARHICYGVLRALLAK